MLVWLHGHGDPHHRGLTLASVAGAALVALVTFRPWGGLETGAFRTLGFPESADSPARKDVRVVFAPSTNMQRVIESLASVNGRIIDGPTQLGVFTVRLEATTGDEEPLAALVARLREDAAIVLAEPAVPYPVKDH
ncbi:hypothetical protein [Methylotetracoccus oryzae]|uniref:hypothetical protein n=1 Tax=Methylotetracoccus oryzae TaxID=1919059 RepID=UPI0011196EE1|nr:hypothetical protein [Methylotetracoccus oryzae]